MGACSSKHSINNSAENGSSAVVMGGELALEKSFLQGGHMDKIEGKPGKLRHYSSISVKRCAMDDHALETLQCVIRRSLKSNTLEALNLEGGVNVHMSDAERPNGGPQQQALLLLELLEAAVLDTNARKHGKAIPQSSLKRVSLHTAFYHVMLVSHDFRAKTARIGPLLQQLLDCHPNLEYLGIHEVCDIYPTDSLVQGVSYAVQQQHQLQELHLSNCGIDDTHVNVLVRALLLKRVTSQAPKRFLEVLNLSCNNLTSESLPILAKLLNNATTCGLQTLTLNQNYDLFGMIDKENDEQENIGCFIEAVEKSTLLHNLHLHSCGLNVRHTAIIQKLFCALTVNFSLRTLNLSYNAFNWSALLQCLTETLPEMKGLKVLGLNGASFLSKDYHEGGTGGTGWHIATQSDTSKVALQNFCGALVQNTRIRSIQWYTQAFLQDLHDRSAKSVAFDFYWRGRKRRSARVLMNQVYRRNEMLQRAEQLTLVGTDYGRLKNPAADDGRGAALGNSVALGLSPDEDPCKSDASEARREGSIPTGLWPHCLFKLLNGDELATCLKSSDQHVILGLDAAHHVIHSQISTWLF